MTIHGVKKFKTEYKAVFLWVNGNAWSSPAGWRLVEFIPSSTDVIIAVIAREVPE